MRVQTQVGRRVLVVDGCVDVAESLAALVASCGHQARVALDGPLALAVAASYRPDAVLLDLDLPRVGDQELARLFRTQAGALELLMAALSDTVDMRYQRLAREAGFDHFLTKPVASQTLVELLGRG